MAKAQINSVTVQDPQMLADLLNHFDIEIDTIRTLVNEIKSKYNSAVTLINELKTDLHQHTHGGVTTGAGNTGAGPQITSADAATVISPNVIEEIERGK